ncbi:UNVERIFIED_CONTAM: hypothetical protein Sangu_3079800 [Sesamum angustifolium]|uniref:DUF4218 domain-containing protein n=1 Tax=Sesamum angustifolium TaxID=2727405 RepID=A0AAW2K7B3_9LAMI
MSWKTVFPSSHEILRRYFRQLFRLNGTPHWSPSVETRVGGPVQYRWMYPFERFLRELKKKVKNKAHVEASIVEAYFVEEIGLFASQYFELDVQSKRSMPQKNNECTSRNDGF